MKFEVETKFDIGEEVYIPEPCMYWLPNNTPSMITDIQVKYSKSGTGIFYGVHDNHTPVREDMCFGSLEECRQWCKEQNEKDGAL